MAIEWQIATVQTVKRETPRVKTFTLDLSTWAPHRAGQHYDLRLTAPDGYQAERSYSVASEPERKGKIDLTVELLEDGEVSSYLHGVVVPGDRLEVRGPIGGYFVWEASFGGPLLLVAGGSGIVPLMSMIRHRDRAGATVKTALLYSSRAPDDVIYAEELQRLERSAQNLNIALTYTRTSPPGWRGYDRRIDSRMLAEVIGPLGDSPLSYVCGPTMMVEAVADGLVGLGVPPARIRTERFGPTGTAG